jgi:enolase 1/2/3
MSGAFGIRRVWARQILDSRANPTVEAKVTLAGGAQGWASVPSGASTGSNEAHELRDRDLAAWGGRGVERAVAHVREELAQAVLGLDAREQWVVDAALRSADGTAALSRLGANAVLAVSLATARAAARSEQTPLYRYFAALAGAEPLLPLPMVNMISGGAHAGHNLDIQDVLAIPVGAASYREGLDWIVRLYWALRGVLIAHGHPPLVGDEGGFGPALARNEDAPALVVEAIAAAGLQAGAEMALALDVAASEFYRDGQYRLEHEPAMPVADATAMVHLMDEWSQRYPIVSIEDPLAEDDWEGWRQLNARLGGRLQLIGDDLFVTSAARLQRGIDAGTANAVLVKVNQAGTLSDALETVHLARQHGYRAVISARSGETEDDWLADLAVGSGAGQIKVGSVARSERLAKYNRLLRLEEELDSAAYAGGSWPPMAR